MCCDLNEIKAKAFEYIDLNQTEMIKLLEELVINESSSYDILGVNNVIEIISKIVELEAIETKVIQFEGAGSTLIASCKGTNENLPPIVLIGHCDTVYSKGTIEKMPFTIQGDKCFGPGVLDMKGGLVIAIYIIKALKYAKLYGRTIKLIVSGDEEIGHEVSNSQSLIKDECKGALACFVLETGYRNNKIIIKRKGVGRMTMECFGVSAHAGICPENGKNAILEMSHKIIEIQSLNKNNEGTTYNVGTVVGGNVANSVPDYCKVDIDIRYSKKENIKHILEKLKEIENMCFVDGVKTKLSGHISFEPMEDTKQNQRLFEIVKMAAEDLGYQAPYKGETGGGSDAACSSAVGVPTVCSMGIQGSKNHTPEEYAFIDSLSKRAKLIINSILSIESYINNGGTLL